jgi:hypothetical protein
MGTGFEDVPIPLEGDAYADTDPSALSDFRGPLENHGTWVDDPTYGTTWMPEPAEVGPDFAPYVSAGHWSYQDDMVWVSEYEWGWVPFHYGRWVLVERGWAWIPGRAYAGAWVDWQMGDLTYAYVGWSPTAPEFAWRGGLAVALGAAAQAPVTYVPATSVFAPQVSPHVVTGPQAAAAAGHTTPYVPASPVPGRVPAHPVPRGTALSAVGIDASKLAAISPDRGTVRAQLIAVPSSALRFGARPPVPHVVRIDHASPLFATGSWRTRWPVAANTAFATAGATGGTPGSPAPPGRASLPTRSTVMPRGASPMRARR